MCPSVLKGSGDGTLQLIFVHFWTFVILLLQKMLGVGVSIVRSKGTDDLLVIPIAPSSASNLYT